MRSREDVVSLVACAGLVGGLCLLLGWRGERLLSGYDAVNALLPMVQALVAAGGDPSALAYRPELLGGAALRDTLGPQPLLVLPAALGLSATQVLNLAILAVQALFSFFGQRLLSDLAALLGRPAWPAPVRVVLGTALLGFAPFVGWRVGYGHLTLLVGLLPFLAALVLLCASTARSSSLALVVIAVLAVTLGLPFVGQQLVLCGAVFGLPILAGAWWGGGHERRRLLVPALAVLAGLLLAAPGFLPMLAHALGGDALRDLGGPTMTYSYLTAAPMDWLLSLPWRVPPWAGRPPIRLHESNLPLGPLALLLVLQTRRARPLLLGLLTSAVLAVAFASDLRPLSDLLLAGIPPLRSFRVPTRALLPALAVMPLLAVAPLASGGWHTRPWRLALGGVLGAAVLFSSPPLWREILGWGLCLALVFFARQERPAGQALALPVVLALSGGSLGAFQERLLPYPDAEALLASARLEGEAARRAEPALARPLVRVALETDRHPLGANRAFAAGLAGLDGYAFPQRRFVALVRALRGEPYSPNALLLRFHEAYLPSRVLFQLYDVAFALEDDAPRASSRVKRRGPTAGTAWFPSELVEDPRVEDLAAALLEWGDDTHAQARRTLRIVAADPAWRGRALAVPAECASARAGAVEAMGTALRVDVETPSGCPLVLATNYAEGLEARGLADGVESRLSTFPAYGALLGVEVKAGATRVEVRPRRWPPGWTLPMAGVGLMLAALAARLRG